MMQTLCCDADTQTALLCCTHCAVMQTLCCDADTQTALLCCTHCVETQTLRQHCYESYDAHTVLWCRHSDSTVMMHTLCCDASDSTAMMQTLCCNASDSTAMMHALLWCTHCAVMQTLRKHCYDAHTVLWCRQLLVSSICLLLSLVSVCFVTVTSFLWCNACCCNLLLRMPTVFWPLLWCRKLPGSSVCLLLPVFFVTVTVSVSPIFPVAFQSHNTLALLVPTVVLTTAVMQTAACFISLSATAKYC